MTFMRHQQTGSDFLPLHQHRVVAISVALRTGDSFKVWSLGDEESAEAEIVGRFFDGIERYAPDLVSWNGSGFDLPVLHYRALRHGIQAPRYWEVGDGDREYKWNNYLGRFHWRHVDLMDVLSGYQHRGRASLDQTAVLLGFPGKLGMSGDKVWEKWLAGGIREIRDYCETDVLNTWLIFLRFEFMRGNRIHARQSRCPWTRARIRVGSGNPERYGCDAPRRIPRRVAGVRVSRGDGTKQTAARDGNYLVGYARRTRHCRHER
jgi:predicted PolB exonuclease-like 3'-5' exonuclease